MRLLVLFVLTSLTGVAVSYFIAWLVGLVLPSTKVPVFVLGCGWWLWIGWQYAKAKDYVNGDAKALAPSSFPTHSQGETRLPVESQSPLAEKVASYKGSEHSILWVPLASLYIGKCIKEFEVEPMDDWAKQKLMDSSDVSDPSKQNGYELSENTVLFEYPWMTRFFTYEEYVYEVEYQINCKAKKFGDELFAAAKTEISSVLAEGLELMETLHMWLGIDGKLSVRVSHTTAMSTVFINVSQNFKPT